MQKFGNISSPFGYQNWLTGLPQRQNEDEQLDDCHPPSRWGDENVLIDLGEEMSFRSEEVHKNDHWGESRFVLPDTHANVKFQHRDQELPRCLMNVPLLEKLFLSNSLNYDLVNSNLMAVVSHKSVLKQAFHEKRAKVRRLARYRDPQFREIKFVNDTWLALIEKQLVETGYEFKPEQEVEVPLPSGRLRLMSIPSPKDEVVLEALRLVLEAIYEPCFLDYSHGFRPDKGRQSALREIKRYFGGMDYFIVCNLEHALQEYKGHEMVKNACLRISDPLFQKLLYKAVAIGYVNFCGLDSSGLVVKQKEMGISPILLNIYLHELDLELEKIKLKYRRGYSLADLSSTEVPTQALNRKIRFVRHAGTVFVGIQGERNEAKALKALLAGLVREKFLMGDTVKVTLHEGHEVPQRSKMAQFLGFVVCSDKFDGSGYPSHMHQVLKSQIRPKLLIPTWKVMNMFKRVGFVRKVNSATSRGNITNWPPGEIVKYFDQHVQALMEYYAMADSYRDLQHYVYLLKKSCALTLARKHKMRSVRKAYTKYGVNLVVKDSDRFLASLPNRSLSARPLIKEFHPYLNQQAAVKRKKVARIQVSDDTSDGHTYWEENAEQQGQ